MAPRCVQWWPRPEGRLCFLLGRRAGTVIMLVLIAIFNCRAGITLHDGHATARAGNNTTRHNPHRRTPQGTLGPAGCPGCFGRHCSNWRRRCRRELDTNPQRLLRKRLLRSDNLLHFCRRSEHAGRHLHQNLKWLETSRALKAMDDVRHCKCRSAATRAASAKTAMESSLERPSIERLLQ